MIDGSYLKVRDLVWPRADTLVWLDIPLRVTLGRMLIRTIRRVGKRQELWNGNRETLRGSVLSRDSLFVYAITTHIRRRRMFTELVNGREAAHLPVFQLRSPSEITIWFTGNVGPPTTPAAFGTATPAANEPLENRR